MADTERTLVDKLVLHHAVTPLWDEKSKSELAQYFSDNGFARGYSSNPNNWSGLINPYTGERSYSQAHLAGQQVTDRTPDATPAERAAGYRLVRLIQDIWGQITWHAANWPINQGSIGIENLGDYRNYTLREGDNRVIADFWRGRDQQLGGATTVYGHLEVSLTGTECPARIMEQRDHIVDLVNNPPASEPQPAPITEVSREVFNPLKSLVFIRPTHLVDLPGFGNPSDDYYPAGLPIEVQQLLTFSDGTKAYRTKYSSERDIARGFNADDLSPPPTTTATTTEVMIEPTTTTTTQAQTTTATTTMAPGPVPTTTTTTESVPPIPPIATTTTTITPEKNNSAVEAAKLVGRNGVLAAVSALVMAFANWAVTCVVGLPLPGELSLSMGAVVYAILLYVDKKIHENADDLKGLVPF